MHTPLCNDTIIVLKIILLHTVSVITNFVNPKRDKNRQTFSIARSGETTDTVFLNITLFRPQPARDERSPPYVAR